LLCSCGVRQLRLEIKSALVKANAATRRALCWLCAPSRSRKHGGDCPPSNAIIGMGHRLCALVAIIAAAMYAWAAVMSAARMRRDTFSPARGMAEDAVETHAMRQGASAACPPSSQSGNGIPSAGRPNVLTVSGRAVSGRPRPQARSSSGSSSCNSSGRSSSSKAAKAGPTRRALCWLCAPSRSRSHGGDCPLRPA